LNDWLLGNNLEEFPEEEFLILFDALDNKLDLFYVPVKDVIRLN
jgi:hypothetical protein